MKPLEISLTQLKKGLGEYLLDVRRAGKTFHVVDYRYRPPRIVARLGSPEVGDVVIDRDGTVHGELLDTRHLRGTGIRHSQGTPGGPKEGAP